MLWESAALEAWFPPSGRLLVTAAGGGREVLALEPIGFEIEAFECNPRLTEAANRHLQKHRFKSRVAVCPRDEAPRVAGQFDGIIVGWGSYTLIMQRSTRISFLRTLAQQLAEGAPILLSYFKLDAPPSRVDRIQHGLANWLRTMRGAPRLAPHDVMDWNYRHRFTDDEVREELSASGFETAHVSDDVYPHAVGIRRRKLDG
jgi:hypothetical protein